MRQASNTMFRAIEQSILAEYSDERFFVDNQMSRIDRFHVERYLHHHRKLVRAVVKSVIRWSPGRSVAEIGPAYGATLMALQQSGKFEVQGFELAANIPVYCSALKSAGVPIQCADLYASLPIEPERFDLVILSEVVEHLYCDLDAVAEVVRPAIRIGGRLLVTTPNIYRLTNLVKIAVGRNIVEGHAATPRMIAGQSVDGRCHPIEYTCQDLRNTFGNRGWRLVALWTDTLDTPTKAFWERIAIATVPKNLLYPTGQTIFAVAERTA